MPEQPPPAPRFASHDMDGVRLPPHMNTWGERHPFWLHAFYGCSNTTEDLTALWSEGDLDYSFDASNHREVTLQLWRHNASDCLQRAWLNETIYLHLFATSNETCCSTYEMHSVHELTTYKQLPREGKRAGRCSTKRQRKNHMTTAPSSTGSPRWMCAYRCCRPNSRGGGFPTPSVAY